MGFFLFINFLFDVGMILFPALSIAVELKITLSEFSCTIKYQNDHFFSGYLIHQAVIRSCLVLVNIFLKVSDCNLLSGVSGCFLDYCPVESLVSVNPVWAIVIVIIIIVFFFFLPSRRHIFLWQPTFLLANPFFFVLTFQKNNCLSFLPLSAGGAQPVAESVYMASRFEPCFSFNKFPSCFMFNCSIKLPLSRER